MLRIQHTYPYFDIQIHYISWYILPIPYVEFRLPGKFLTNNKDITLMLAGPTKRG